jgi:hypothetical protein
VRLAKRLKRAFRNDAINTTQTFELYSLFQRGQISVEDFEGSGRQSSSRSDENVEKLRPVIHKDKRPATKDVLTF